MWPDDDLLGLPVLLPGGEVGVLTHWEHPPRPPHEERPGTPKDAGPSPSADLSQPEPTGLPQRAGPMPCSFMLLMIFADSLKPTTTIASGLKSTICWTTSLKSDAFGS